MLTVLILSFAAFFEAARPKSIYSVPCYDAELQWWLVDMTDGMIHEGDLQ
jgi:hypothetical protein